MNSSLNDHVILCSIVNLFRYICLKKRNCYSLQHLLHYLYPLQRVIPHKVTREGKKIIFRLEQVLNILIEIGEF